MLSKTSKAAWKVAPTELIDTDEASENVNWWTQIDYEGLLANNGVICALVLSIVMSLLYSMPAEEMDLHNIRYLLHLPGERGLPFRTFVVAELEAIHYNFTIQFGDVVLDAKRLLLDSSKGKDNALPFNVAGAAQGLMELEAIAKVFLPHLDLGRLNGFIIMHMTAERVGSPMGAEFPSAEFVSIGTIVSSILSVSMLGSMITYLSYAMSGSLYPNSKTIWAFYGLPATILLYVFMVVGLIYFYFFLLVVGRIRFSTFSFHAIQHEKITLFTVILFVVLFALWNVLAVLRTSCTCMRKKTK